MENQATCSVRKREARLDAGNGHMIHPSGERLELTLLDLVEEAQEDGRGAIRLQERRSSGVLRLLRSILHFFNLII